MIKKAIITMLTALSITSADMYDGCRAPTKGQADNRITISEEGIGYKPILKYFGKDLFVAAAFPTVNGRLKAVGGGLGLIIDNLKCAKIIPVLNYGIPVDGSGIGLEPTIYATSEVGRVTIDPRIWSSMFVNKDKVKYNGIGTGLTVGVGLTDRVRIGADVERTPDGKVNGKGIAQMVLEPKKQVLEAYLGSKNAGLCYIYHIGAKHQRKK